MGVVKRGGELLPVGVRDEAGVDLLGEGLPAEGVSLDRSWRSERRVL